MNTTTSCRGWRRCAAVVAALSITAIGCRDVASEQARPVLNAPRAVEGHLAFSNESPGVGEEFVVSVNVLEGAGVERVASFTARVLFDPATARFAREEALEDGALRVVNPMDGEARIAGIALHGFADTRLMALRFTALAAGATTSMGLMFDELHSTDRADLAQTVVTRQPGDRRTAR